MKYRLIELKLSGIKCIEKEIEIFFAKRNFDMEFFDESIVKSIMPQVPPMNITSIHNLPLLNATPTVPTLLNIDNFWTMTKNIIYERNVTTNKIAALIHVWYFVSINNSKETIINIFVNKVTLQNQSPPTWPFSFIDSSVIYMT